MQSDDKAIHCDQSLAEPSEDMLRTERAVLWPYGARGEFGPRGRSSITTARQFNSHVLLSATAPFR